MNSSGGPEPHSCTRTEQPVRARRTRRSVGVTPTDAHNAPSLRRNRASSTATLNRHGDGRHGARPASQIASSSARHLVVDHTDSDAASYSDTSSASSCSRSRRVPSTSPRLAGSSRVPWTGCNEVHEIVVHLVQRVSAAEPINQHVGIPVRDCGGCSGSCGEPTPHVLLARDQRNFHEPSAGLTSQLFELTDEPRPSDQLGNDHVASRLQHGAGHPKRNLPREQPGVRVLLGPAAE